MGPAAGAHGAIGVLRRPAHSAVQSGGGGSGGAAGPLASVGTSMGASTGVSAGASAQRTGGSDGLVGSVSGLVPGSGGAGPRAVSPSDMAGLVHSAGEGSGGAGQRRGLSRGLGGSRSSSHVDLSSLGRGGTGGIWDASPAEMESFKRRPSYNVSALRGSKAVGQGRRPEGQASRTLSLQPVQLIFLCAVAASLKPCENALAWRHQGRNGAFMLSIRASIAAPGSRRCRAPELPTARMSRTSLPAHSSAQR